MIRTSPNRTSTLRLAALLVALPLVGIFSGCAAKHGPSPLRVSISMDDTIYAPGEEAVVTVRVENPDANGRQVELPNPANTRLYVSMMHDEGGVEAKGKLAIEAEGPGETVTIDGGGSVETALRVAGMAEEAAMYIVFATYSNRAEAGGSAVASNRLDLRVE